MMTSDMASSPSTNAKLSSSSSTAVSSDAITTTHHGTQQNQTEPPTKEDHHNNNSMPPSHSTESVAVAPEQEDEQDSESLLGQLHLRPHQLAHKFFINAFLMKNQQELQQHTENVAAENNHDHATARANQQHQQPQRNNQNDTIAVNGRATIEKQPPPPQKLPPNGTSTTENHRSTPESNYDQWLQQTYPHPQYHHGQPPQHLIGAPLHHEHQPPLNNYNAAIQYPPPPPPPQYQYHHHNQYTTTTTATTINNNNNNNINVARQRPILRKRKSFAAVSRKQVEGMVAFKFVNSAYGKQVLDRHSLFSTMPSTTTAATPAAPATPAAASAANHHHHHKQDKARFNKFSLVYNECSLATIGKWVWDHDTNHRNTNNNKHHQPQAHANGTTTMLEDFPAQKPPAVLHRPTAAVVFRKCLLCYKFGHYDIECPQLENDEAAAIQLAQDVQIQKSLQDNAAAAAESDAAQHDVDHEHTAVADEDDDDEGDVCVFCESRGKREQKTCAGCHAIAHIPCIIPCIKADRVWYCSGCAYEPHRVRTEQATVEMEHCQGFVIEQRTRPRNSEAATADEFEFALERGWQTVVGVRAAEANEPAHQKNNHHKRRRLNEDDDDDNNDDDEDGDSQVDKDEEVTELGGFCIKAQRGNLGKEYSVRDALLHAPLKPGCIVAWFPPAPSTNGDETNPSTATTTTSTTTTTASTTTTTTTSSDPTLGAVMAVSPDQELVLVRPVASWEAVMQYAEEMTKQRNAAQQQQDASSDAWQILAIRASAAKWMPAAMVHMVKAAPSNASLRTFRQEVLPRRLAEERQQLLRHREAAAERKMAPPAAANNTKNG